MAEKKILMCVEPDMVYIDSDMETWEPITCVETPCAICETLAPGGRVFENVAIDEVICENCVTTVIPAEMFEAYEKRHQLTEILSRFTTTLINCEREFKRHLPNKGESWLQDGTDWLFTNIQRVAAKLLLADSKEAQLDETIDLILSAMMLAERYLRDNDKGEDDIPF